MSRIKLASGDRYAAWESQETRQEYATRVVNELRARRHMNFDELLFEFCMAGLAYDAGSRTYVLTAAEFVA